MKQFLLLALALVGCVTSPENSGSRPAYLLPDGQYQSKDNQLSFTLNYPNWKAVYYTITPNIVASGFIDAIAIDSSTRGQINPFITIHAASFSVTEFHQQAADGTKLACDTATFKKLGYQVDASTGKVGTGVQLASIRNYWRLDHPDSVVSVDTSFVFTGHTLR